MVEEHGWGLVDVIVYVVNAWCGERFNVRRKDEGIYLACARHDRGA